MSGFEKALYSGAIPTSGFAAAYSLLTGDSGFGGAPSGSFTGRVFGITKRVYDLAGEVISIAVANTYYEMDLVTASQGTITNITDNNDGSFTNNNSSAITINGLILAQGGNSTARRYNVGAATDNSGSMTIIEDNAGDNLALANIRGQGFHFYSVTLNAGKTVAPMLQNHASTANYTMSSFTHKVWN